MARTHSKLEAAVADIAKVATAKVHWISCDVGDEDKVNAAMQESVDVHGGEIDVCHCD
jgi:short-subunit dehydrogenase